MSTALERQIRPIYEALDTGSNKSAILSCNKLLKKHPKNDLVKALKALALVRSQKVEESLMVCDEVLAAKPTDESTLAAMMHVLRGLGRHTDMVAMYEDAYKQHPTNEELGTQAFMANVRIGNWKAAQQIATKLHKQFRDDHYLYWSVMSAVLQASDPTTPPGIRPVLFKLAHRLVVSATTPSFYNADRFYLHLMILRELGLYDEAYELLNNDVGRAICASSLTVDELRRDIWQRKGLVGEEGARAKARITEAKDRNWLEFLAVLDATFVESQEDVSARIEETRKLFEQIADEDGRLDRSGRLALLELEKRAIAHGISTSPAHMSQLLQQYFTTFGDKLVCFEDLQSYVRLEGDALAEWTSFLDSQSSSFATVDVLNRYINAQKLLRYNLPASEITADTEAAHAVQYLHSYLDALKLGKDLPDTELQPADDLALLSGQAFVGAWRAGRDVTYLYSAVSVLEYASSRSKQSYKMRLLLIRLYRLLGAPSLALEQYRAINVKQIQNDTLSHLIMTRATLFSLSSMGDLTYSTEALESSQIYISNSQETAEYTVRAFAGEKYSQLPEFILFEERLDNSLQRDLTKIEHVRMRITHEPLASDLVDMELIELKFIFDRFHHDNRDFDVIPNYQPRSGLPFHEQTLLCDKQPGLGWLATYLRIYIKLFQSASDLDDTVEDKLLIGDRPKPSVDPDTKLPLRERLAMQKPEELEELTPEEQSFLEYATALSNWLAPFHDYIRPPPAAVLAEAAKQTELKTGFPLKGYEPPKNGTATNGHAKKAEEPPTLADTPEIVNKFFDDMSARFKEALEAGRLPPELLQIVTLTQEGFLVLALETQRFKPAGIIKQYRLGAMVQIFKDIRTKATAVLEEMSATLVKLGEEGATIDSRKAFVESCKPVWGPSGLLDHDFVSTISKKVTESRKLVLEGVGKGVVRVCKNHA
ncbi:N-acetyltransferase B complex non catalytic subunit-domain-containing protein [Fomitopsis serialis]|uniref:N-acetyltransferase B complex non catalytic subunit-domain-containing protein n=1 Tax=Fomitopsis serialis TaxID=139415 RepID=UPI00200721BF|nr:N-acetyltransferase B complex non catalytic subunit-domain-containing protein [Neoantrodia serialis]KAH9935019.1 N-acetyltransferase B complex non catalytic subunit-domain-containing protein [Neoantrodia serialis]